MYKKFFGTAGRSLLTLFSFLILLSFFYSLYKFSFSPKFYEFFYLKFVIIFGIIFFLFVCLNSFFKDKIIIYCNIFIISCFVSLLLIEIFFQLSSKIILNDISIRSEQARKLGIKFDKRSKFEFYQDYKKIDADAVPSIPPNDFFLNYREYKNKNDLYAISGVSKKNTVFCNEGGTRTVYLSDRYGFRNRDKFWEDEKIDIVLLGDSLAQGACVSDRDTIHERIIHYTGKSFLNLGYQGHGPLMQLASLKEYASTKKPKKVIWFYSETNDIDNLIYEYEWKIFYNYLYDDNYSQNLLIKQQQIDNDHTEIFKSIYSDRKLADRQKVTKKKLNIFSEIKSVLKFYKIRNFVSYFIPRRYSLILHGYSPINTFKIYEQIIDKAVEITESWGGNFYFVYYPHASRYFDSIIHPYHLRKYEYVKKIISNKNVKVIDLKKEVFEKYKDTKGLYPLRMSGHPNEKGYDLVAEYISKIIMQN